MVGFITDSLLSAGVAVPLTKPDEDVAVFGDVGFDDDRGLLIASGGTLSPNGISVMRIRDLAGHAANGTFEQVRGSAEEIHLHAASRHGVHRFALPRSGTRVAPGTLVSNRLPILYSSNNGWDHSVKQGEVAEGAFRCTQSYDGHRGEVTAVVAPPYFSEVKGPTGTFATAARDGCVLLWDRGHGAIPLHRFRTTTSPAVAYDSTGMVLAVTGSYDAVQLYDLRMLRRGEAVPFAVVPTGLKPTETPLSLQFCPYASSEAPKEHLLIAGASTLSRVNTFAASPNAVSLTRTTAPHTPSGAAAFLPDGAVTFRGSASGDMHAVSAQNGSVLHTWSAAATGLGGPADVCRFSEAQWAAAFVSGRTLACIVWPYYY